MSFQIVSQTTVNIVAGKLVEKGFHYVADETGELVGKKAHSTVEEAQVELSGMAGLEVGLEFAKAAFPDLSPKAQVAKANIVAEYKAWEDAGRPVKEATGVVADEAEAPAVEVEPAPADEEQF